MIKFITDCFTEADGKTWDLGRIQWFIGTLVFFGVSLFSYIYHGQTFDPVAWATGFSGTLLAGGGMIWLKDKEKNGGQ